MFGSVKTDPTQSVFDRLVWFDWFLVQSVHDVTTDEPTTVFLF